MKFYSITQDSKSLCVVNFYKGEVTNPHNQVSGHYLE